MAVAINVNAGEVKDTASLLDSKDQERTLMGSIDESAETISITGFLSMP